MSNTDNTFPSPEDQLDDAESRPSGTMLVTLVLLIAGLLLSSFMMLHYGFKAGGKKATLPSLNFSELKPYQHELNQSSLQESVAQEDSSTEQDSGGISQLLASRSEKVRWPRLRVTGFGRSSDGTGFAIINGKQVFLGELVDGKAKLIEVRSHDVVVEYMGETRILSDEH